ncbi:MAG: MBL fold metallo-hydrolase [Abditibacteriota bacterium]|nr:MBL fold metallo-hydrolase [Abditibacteriota bacterium]
MLKTTLITAGPFETNTYVLQNTDTGDAVLVDPCCDFDRVTDIVDRELQARVQAILITHGHFDHNFGAGFFEDKYAVPVYMNHRDIELVEMLKPKALMWGFAESDFRQPSRYTDLRDGDRLEPGGIGIRVLEAPGHSRGSLVYVTDAGAFCGDVIFRLSIGRYDFEGGNREELMESISSKILTLPDDTPLYPGHGEVTTVGFERLANPYIRDCIS